MSSTLSRARQLFSYFSSSIKPPTSPISSATVAAAATSPPTTRNMATGNDQPITQWTSLLDPTGEFKRGQSAFRNWISREPGARFPPEKGRYHLYVSYACPWAHRTLITRKLKGLEDIISFTSVHWHMGELGWRFATAEENLPGENSGPDPHHPGFKHLRQIYFDVDPEYKGRFTVPTLYDTKTKTIVSNESSEIIRMLYTEFDDLLPEKYKNVDLFPEHLRKDIEETNEWTYNNVNNGVYKCGFATKQEAYENAIVPLFASLDRIESHLQSRIAANASKNTPTYYFGDTITEADIRLYTTIVRFDPVYVQHFKANIRDIRSGYPAIHHWLRQLYWDVPAFGETTQFEHIKKHYTTSHTQINPFGITPVGPLPDILPKDKEVAAVAATRQ
ncbi:glutathione S-transferase [Blastomyces dermatitidis ER-3]|uniref:Glutathione S-transferase n=3 Tax=Blastomyces TaxID=229219 RepID=A0A179U8F1_BLAGS|nr:glutathione S-transferase [Blastomyces gilchristii SLH14081]XP_045277657.1 glutathione S-transferase [Blastomyces dermatitidis ER-3]EEQ91044.1 glutathione S-transferase [Blastomyces dermatitidis ER-3]EGE82267.1 glutathione S-transferase [Blastomyces dermatitidis ATCC 18188]OAT04264.1 glutathione S-transferase [Blastomyces gilchristii SLH14081]